MDWVVTHLSRSLFLETSLRFHMFQLSRFVREFPVFVLCLPCCRANTKSLAEINPYHLYYNNSYCCNSYIIAILTLIMITMITLV